MNTRKEQEDKWKKIELEIIDYIQQPSGVTAVTISPNKYDYWDCIVNEKYLTEIKSRDFDREYFENEFNNEYLLEVEKYNHLKQMAEEANYQIIYIYGFTDGLGKPKTEDRHLLGWNILNLSKLDMSSVPVKKRKCVENTVNGQCNYVLKDCYLIGKEFLQEGMNEFKRVIN